MPFANLSMRFSIDGLLIFIVIFVTTVKLFLLDHLGIKLFGDYIGYSAYADILAGGVPDRSNWMDITTFRQPGYPLLILLARAISVEHHNFILVSLNIAATTIACCFVYFAIRRLGFGRILAAAAYIVVNFSELLVWELTPLPSSLAAAFYIGVASYTLAILHKGALPSNGALLLVGAITGCAMLLSEWALFFAMVNIGVLLLFGLIGKGTVLRVLGLSLGPGALIFACLLSWNQARTGNAFLTTGWITAGLHPVVVAADRGLFVLDPANRTDALIAAELQRDKPNVFRHTLAILNEIHAENPSSSIEFAKTMQRYFVDAFSRQPYAMVANSLRNIEEGIEASLQPAFSRIYWYNWPPGSRVFPVVARLEQMFRHARVFDALGITVNILSMVIVPIFALICALLKRGDQTCISIILASSIFSVTPFIMFAPIHMEIRYVVCTIPFVLLNFLLFVRFAWIGVALEPRIR